MGKKEIILLTLILATAGIVWFLLVPAYSSLKTVMSDYADWQARLQEAEELKDDASRIKEGYDRLSDNAKRIVDAVPQGESLPALLAQLESLTSQSGLVLNDLNVEGPQEESKKPAVAGTVANDDEESAVSPSPSAAASPSPAATQQSADQKGYKSLNVKLSLAGDLSSLRSFLRAVENNLQIMDVSSISFGAKSAATDKQTGGKTDSEIELNKYEVELITYYR